MMSQEKHVRGLICDDCGSNLAMLYYYSRFGALARTEDKFFCPQCKKIYAVSKQFVG